MGDMGKRSDERRKHMTETTEPEQGDSASSHAWDYDDLPEYQEFLSECAKQCRCSMTICESVLCGAPCEERIERDYD